ncbi:MAG: hypothetical protein Q8K78_00640 [Planctomycetaceae bacterium]|nr:hypothetical protein [Planctomycetaceae bacterium]
MIGLSVLIFSLLIAAPPAAPGVRIQTAAQGPATIRTATATKPRTVANSPRRVATASSPIRMAQVPPKPELPPQPLPLQAPPLPIETTPNVADPYEAPRVAPPPPAIDDRVPYAGPVIAEPLGLPPGPPMEPAYGPEPVPGPGEFVDGYGYGGGCPTCYGCPGDDDDDDCCLCNKIPHPCNMYPHYAYYPKYHGHYYFRPYNYTTVFQHQQWATTAGIDPRNPYSNKIFCAAMAGFAQSFRPENGPIGSALPVGNGLPQLEELLNAKTLPLQPVN